MKEALIIGERYRQLLAEPLRDFGVEVLWMRDNPRIDPRLAGHADLSAIRLGKKIICSNQITDNPLYVNNLTYRGYELYPAINTQDKRYPSDANLCACIVGKHLIHNLRYTDPAVLENYIGEKIHVNQGYARCSCCAVDDTSLISADSGIENAVRGKNIEVLKISAGGIRLPGFDYGFIGGASVVLNDIVLFSGRLENTRDMRCIESFVRSRGKHVVFLSNKQALDIGGAVVL